MTTKVDHNYPVPGDLIIVDEDTGLPIQDVRIRIYVTANYPPPTNVQDTWTAETSTNEKGEWKDPVYLPDGTAWTVELSRNLTYGTETVEITT
jgi:hypothetical protein